MSQEDFKTWWLKVGRRLNHSAAVYIACKAWDAAEAKYRAQLEHAEHWKNDWYTKLSELEATIQRLREGK